MIIKMTVNRISFGMPKSGNQAWHEVCLTTSPHIGDITLTASRGDGLGAFRGTPPEAAKFYDEFEAWAASLVVGQTVDVEFPAGDLIRTIVAKAPAEKVIN